MSKNKVAQPKGWDLRIAVCVPGSRGHSGFTQCLSNMLIHFCLSPYKGGTREVEMFSCTGSILPDVRHICVAEAVKWDATHMLFLDDDMHFPRDTLHRLLKHNLPVVGANYVRRTFPCIPTAYNKERTGPVYTDISSTGLEEVSHVGTGVMLIDMRVFDQIELPYFELRPEPGKIKPKGEDVYFCHKLGEAGIPVFVDHDLSKEIGHYGDMCYIHALAGVPFESVIESALAYQIQKKDVESTKQKAA